jgi:catechol 2,3-dioxygenase-like lactoylglutathione lyase family enzyme
MAAHLSVISLWAKDVIQAAYFYKDVLGLSLTTHHAGMPHFDLGGVTLVILQGTPSPVKDSHPDRFPLFALSMDDFDTVLSRLEAHKIALPWGVESGADSRWVRFYDPAGNLIEIVEWK